MVQFGKWNQLEGLFTKRRSLLALAAFLTLVSAAYSGIWAYYIRLLPQGTIGVTFRPLSPGDRNLEVIRISTGSPAQSAGLLLGDQIVKIDGRPLDSIAPWVDLVARARPGTPVVLTLERGSGTYLQRAVRTPGLPSELAHPTLAQVAIMNLLLSYPLLFLTVGMVVLWFRPQDRNAWLLALMFTGFIALAAWVTAENEALVPLAIRIGAIGLIELPLAVSIAMTGSNAPVAEVSEYVRKWLDIRTISTTYRVGAILLGLISLGWNGLPHFGRDVAEQRLQQTHWVRGTCLGVVGFGSLGA